MVFPQCIASLTLTPETTSANAKCYQNGQLSSVAERITQNDWLLELNYEFIDFATMQYALFGQTSQSGPALVPTQIVTAGTATIVEDDVNSTIGNEASLKLYNSTEGVPMTLAAASPPGVNEFFVTTTATEATIELNAAQVGQTITYVYDKSYTSIESIGESGQFDEINDFSLSAIVSSSVEGVDAFVLVAPRIARTNYPSLSFSGGEKATLSIQYRLLLQPGEKFPFKMYRLEDAVEA